MARAPGFFDVEERLKRLSDLGDQLEAFTATVDFEVFRPELETALAFIIAEISERMRCKTSCNVSKLG